MKPILFHCVSPLVFFIAGVFFFTSCESRIQQKQPPLPVDVEVNTPETHSWYYFSEKGFEKTALPQLSPQVVSKAWTEAVRISSAQAVEDSGYALVNHLGLVRFYNGRAELHRDASLFSEKTADDLVMMNNRPVFLLYRNTFFSGNAESTSERPVVVQFKEDAGLFFPLLYRSSLQLADGAEVTELGFNDDYCLICVKTTTDRRIKFSYFRIPMIELMRAPSDGGTVFPVHMEEITVDTYRNLVKPLPFNEAPERLRELLSAIPADYTFFLSASTVGEAAVVQYSQQGSNENPPYQGTAITGPTWEAAVFTDGTAYFSGSLGARDIPPRGKKTAFRLPKLPEGYVYGPFSISGDHMIIAWEQTDFYKTGRSGFIDVDLAKVLYNE